jgi:site-specific DNA-methyltransferase (adenine-specific)
VKLPARRKPQPQLILPLPGKRTSTALELPEGLPIDQWEAAGKALHEAEALPWYLGDWWRYGGHEYGKRARMVAKGVFGLSFSTLKTYGWVANKVERSNRLDVLTFVHHMLVASFEPAEQRHWLERAAEGEWSVGELRKQIKAAKRAQRQIASADLPPLSERCRLIHAPVADLAQHLEPDSVDWIVTDPPYPEEFLPCYAELAQMASTVLRPGGSCLVMCGQTYLPQVIAALCSGLTYHWTAAYLTPGGQATQIWPRKIENFWKPLLWFTKGEPSIKHWVGDVCRSDVNDNDKRFHDWGQSESGMADIVERFTTAGQMILDPFLGGATTGLVALRMDRCFIGADSDSEVIAAADLRLRFAEAPA